MKTISIISGTLLLASAFTFCNKDMPVPSAGAPTPYYISMTDAPGPYTEVNIDLRSVEVTSNGKTITLNTNPGIYNLLDFANGVDTLIATGSLTADKVQQIRLILGPNNSVVTASVSYPMTVPSGAESGLKLQVHQTLEAGVAYHVLLDFDANQSVVDLGNGNYHLKPVIRTVQNALSGAIQGSLSVAGVAAAITATNSTSAYSSIPNANGEFIIQGVPAGTYTVNIVPAAPHNSVSINNVQVTTGATTTLGVISI